MFQTIIALFALTLSLLTGAPAPAAPTPPPAPAAVESINAPDATEVLWPAVDNQYAALVQCSYFLDAGADRDACTAGALESFQPIAACTTEDAAGPCYWDAGTRGNGLGESFTVDAAGVVTYLNAATR